MRKAPIIRIALIFLGLIVLGALTYQIPAVKQRLSWRIDFAMAYARGVIDPAGPPPTALPQPEVAFTVDPTATPTSGPTATPSPGPSPTPTPSPTPIPESVSLVSPEYEKQDINNCGPASLAMHLRYFGWEGDQFDIANLLKPQREDRNVNVEELAYYVRTRAGWLNVEYRVGGDLDTLKRMLAAGLPVTIEESFYFEEPYWPNDDLWAAHYFLLTGYDDASRTFTGQDSFYGPDRKVSYEQLDEYWQAFNRVYIVLFLPEQTEMVQSAFGEQWDVETNRRHALEVARAETAADPENPYAWFNLGTNLVYFEEWGEAARAYDRARDIGWPQRMLRYQFGPFFAYFHSGRNDDLMTLTEYALDRTPNAEEALLWHGWGTYRNGDTNQALADFQAALNENPNYQDAQYALNFVRENP